MSDFLEIFWKESTGKDNTPKKKVKSEIMGTENPIPAQWKWWLIFGKDCRDTHVRHGHLKPVGGFEDTESWI